MGRVLKMSRIFVPQLPVVRGLQQNVDDARRFGELVIVFRPEDPRFRHEIYADNIDERMPNLMARAYEMMSDFDPDTDYIALTGGSFFISVCIWAVSHLPHVKLLRYDRNEAAYYSTILLKRSSPSGTQKSDESKAKEGRGEIKGPHKKATRA